MKIIKWKRIVPRKINRFFGIIRGSFNKIFTEDLDSPQSSTKTLLECSALDNIHNGLTYIGENGVHLSVLNTCAFDALAQVYYSLGKDSKYFKNLFQNSSNDFYLYISDLIKNGINFNNNKIRTNLFLNFPSKQFLRRGWLTTIDINCNIDDIIVHFIPRTVEIKFVCPKDKKIKRNQYFFIPINVVTISQADLNNIQGIICLSETTCPKCNGSAPGIKIYSIYGLALVDVQTANLKLFSIKIRQIQQIINIGNELLFLKGIIQFDPPSNFLSANSIGHYRAIINRPNGLWELYDDLETRSMIISTNYKVNPTILIYAKR